VAVYVLIAIVKKHLGLPPRLYTILQIHSLMLFEKIPIPSLFARFDHITELSISPNQLTSFDF
jgi:hypothetical protein